MTKKSASYSGVALKKMLKAHHCPLGLHEVRMRFLGHRRVPYPRGSPIEAVQGLWEGKRPEVDHIPAVCILECGPFSRVPMKPVGEFFPHECGVPSKWCLR